MDDFSHGTSHSEPWLGPRPAVWELGQGGGSRGTGDPQLGWGPSSSRGFLIRTVAGSQVARNPSQNTSFVPPLLSSTTIYCVCTTGTALCSVLKEGAEDLKAASILRPRDCKSMLNPSVREPCIHRHPLARGLPCTFSQLPPERKWAQKRSQIGNETR